MTEMVDGTGTTTYSYSHAGGGVSVFSENGPWSNDTVTVTNQHGLRLGLGIQQPTGSWTARDVYDGMLIVQERNPSTPSVTYTRGLDLSGGLSGAGGIGGLLVRSTGYNSGTGAWSTHTSYHADGNGNVTGLLDSSGNLTASYHYNPWGGLLGITGSHASGNSMRHASKPWFGWRGSNTDGLYYYGYRFYDPTTMRWVNRDPIGEAGFELLRHGKVNVLGDGPNRYAFVSNNPIDKTDFLGLADNWYNRGRCCNRSNEDQWALVDSGEGCARWRKLAPKECVGGMWTDQDCEGMTCNGGFYKVTGYDLSAYCIFKCDDWSMGRRRWTPDPDDRGKGAESPEQRGKCKDESDYPPGYEFGRR